MELLMRRTLIYAIILAAFGFGCQSSSKKSQLEQPSQVIRISIGDEPQTLDPRKARDLNCATILRMLFEGLTRVNSQEKAELALADSVEISTDLKTYTFHLRPSVWSNGDKLTASDFAYAWKKALSPNFPSDTAFHLYVIKNAKAAKDGTVSLDEVGVKAIDDHTLKVELENPTPYFLELAAFPAFFPVNRHVDEKNPSWPQNASTFVGNGPFQLTEWKHTDRMSVKKNPSYWDAGKVKLDSLVMHMVKGETELKMFEKKELDWAGSPLSTLPVDSLETLKASDLLKSKELLGTYFIRTNVERAPFNHPLMRKAFALAINRKAIIDHVTQGNQIPATGLVPISLGLQKEPYFQDGNDEEAKRLFEQGLAAVHLSREHFPDVSLLYYASGRNHLIAQAIQQQWFEAFGIRVKLESIEGKVYFDRVSKQDYHLATGSWIADFEDPINFLDVFKYKNGGSNNTLWENARYAELLTRSSQVVFPEERRQLLASSEKILIDEMPLIPIFYYTMLYIYQPMLKDVVLSSMGVIDFKWASLAEGQEKTIVQGEVK